MMSTAAADPPLIGLYHRRRLRDIWRSAGWPCQDMVEVDLLVAGLVERRTDPAGRDSLRVTDAGLRLLATTRDGHRAARNDHEALVARVALEMHRAGRIVWRGLSLRAPLHEVDSAAPAAPAEPAPSPAQQAASLWPPEQEAQPAPAADPAKRWVMAMPDVFSIRQTSVEDYLLPIVHEIKVRRADLLSDLKNPDKGAAYRALSSECWYVLRAGIGDTSDIPELYGVMLAHPVAGTDGRQANRFGALEVLRPAPRRPQRLVFATWMSLVRATPEVFDEGLSQGRLGEG